MLLLYQIIITITCWHQLFQITSFNQFTSLLALNCSCPNFFWNVLQVWMTGKDVYLQMTWNWPDKTWNILCSYCLQWNTSQSKFRNHYFLFLFAFSILSQLFLIWGCIKKIKNAGQQAKLAARPPGILPVLPMASPPLIIVIVHGVNWH